MVGEASIAGATEYSQIRSDLDLLQGHWVCVAGRRPAEFVVEGQWFTVQFHDGDVYRGHLDVVVDEWPRTMVMSITEGPAKHRGKTTLCIYAFEEDQLRWCPAEPGADDPPPDFPGHDDPRYLCMLFRRDRPAGKKG